MDLPISSIKHLQQWLAAKSHLPIAAILLYLLFIFAGERVMRARKALDLTRCLIVWNASLFLYSLVTYLWLMTDVVQVFHSHALHGLICIAESPSASALCLFLFNLSKVVELGDTCFLVLRKRPVIFLHWYHHVTVLCYTWFATADGASLGRIFATVNALVHTLMYLYYALQAARVHVSKSIAMSITVIQTLQMLLGLSCSLYAKITLWRGGHCLTTHPLINLALLMYLSYFVLFVHFFVQAYVKGTSLKSQITKKSI